MARNWETLQEKHIIRTQVLAFQRSSKMALNPTPSTQLCHTRTLAHVGEYAQAVHALEANAHATPSTKTIVALCHLHPLAKVDFTPLSMFFI
jgi:hypothetical protein